MCKLLYLPVAIALLVADAAGAFRQTVETERLLVTRPVTPGLPQWLGAGVCIDGEWAVASASVDSRAVVNGGSVTVFRRGASGWSEFQQLFPVDLRRSENIGADSTAIDLKGRTLAVSSVRYASCPGFGFKGRVHVFRYNGTEWISEQVLYVPDEASLPDGNSFGMSVCLTSEDEILVGAPGDDTVGTDRGAIYIFRRSQMGQWQPVQKLLPPGDSLTWRFFGDQLDSDGERFVTWPTLIQDLREVAIGEVDAQGRWFIADWINYPQLPGSRAGRPGISGDYIVLPDFGRQCALGIQIRARADVYKRRPNGWSFFQRLIPSTSFLGPIGNCAVGNDQFGRDAAIDGNRIVVGAESGPNGTLANTGHATVFDFDGQGFVETAQLWLSTPEPSSAFGRAVSVHRSSVIVGAPFFGSQSTPTTEPGAVAFFDLPRGQTVCTGAQNSTGGGAVLSVLGSSLVDVGDVYLRTHGLPPSTLCLGLVGSLSGFTPNPGGSAGNLCLAGELGRFVGQAGPSTSDGRFSIGVNVAALPLSSGVTPIASDELWTFQTWYRDQSPTGPTSNFSSAVAARFD